MEDLVADPGCLDEIAREPPSSDADHDRGQPESEISGSFDPDVYLINEFNPNLEGISSYADFIAKLAEATLDSQVEPLPQHLLWNLQTAPDSVLEEPGPEEKLSIDLFLATSSASEATYNRVRDAVLFHRPADEILTLYKVKQLVSDLSGVVPIARDACINTCMAFTGPFSSLVQCSYCGEPRHRPESNETPNNQFFTFPLGPQLQALWRSPAHAKHMKYRTQRTRRTMRELDENNGKRTSPYIDFFDGSDYLDAVRNGNIKDDDVVIMLSLDGAQLYRNKSSDCWMYIWIVLDLPPDMRYKKAHVIPGKFTLRT